MKKYTVIAPAFVVGASCRVELTPEQAKARAYALKRKGGDVYHALENVSFKAVEVIGLDEKALSKAALACLKPEDEPVAPAVENGLKVAHIGGGKYCVVDETGERKTELLPKDQAEAALTKLSEGEDGV